MSRRESRNSLGAGQNDALLEFENFKKKFLLANKHITKLNSTLSVRVEELNGQISVLHVENLRLRAAEIALHAQVKREREKSRTILAETELATLNLTKHLAYLRQVFNISPAAPEPAAPASPRAKRPPSSLHTNPDSPQMNRIARAPNVPGIDEEEEPYQSDSEEASKPPSPTLRKSKDRPRLSGSRLPLPSRMTTPPPTNPQDVFQEPEMETPTVTKRGKSSRRQSGLISIQNEALSVPRSPSPAFGSPIRRAAGLAEEEEENAAIRGEVKVDTDMDIDIEHVVLTMKKERRKSRGKDRDPQDDRSSGSDAIPQTREKKRPREKLEEDSDKDGGGKARMKDTANPRPALSPIGNTVHELGAESSANANTRHALEKSPSPPARMSTSPPPADADSLLAGGRERRARKSVNYAEPKLNTKMRKPDPAPGTAPPPKKRVSAAASLPTARAPPEDFRIDLESDTRSSLEIRRSNGPPKVDPFAVPLPPSRPGSAAAGYATPIPGPRPSSSSSSSSSSAVKKKRSKPQFPLNEDEESDDSAGTQADAEFVGRLGASTWVEGRRRTNSTGSRKGSDDPRRHSTAT